jgi:hypothetical protein
MFILDTAITNEQNNNVYPQVEHMGLDYDWDAPDSATRIEVNDPLQFVPNLNAFHLDPETRFTDVIGQSIIPARGLLVSEAFNRTIQSCIVQRHEKYAAKVVHADSVRNYSWIHLTEKVEDRIDYDASEFHVQAIGDFGKRTIEIADSAALHEICKRLVDTLEGDLKAAKVTFLPETPRYDLFCLQLTLRTFFVSDPLAQRLRAARLTGFTLAPAPTVFVFDERA